MRKGGFGGLEYPQGDNPNGVVFYLISQQRLPRETCEQLIREIAEEFAREGPFTVRVGYREQGDRYWLGLNHEACGAAFEREVDLRAYKIAKQSKLSGPNPNPPLAPVLPPVEFGGSELVEEERSAPAPAPAAEYADHHTGVVFYRFDIREINPAIALEVVKEIAAVMLLPLGGAKPFALRYGIRQVSPEQYWIGLNNLAAATLFERTLEALQVCVTKKSRLPDGSRPVLGLVLILPGVPVMPLPQVAAQPASPSPSPRPAAPVLRPEPHEVELDGLDEPVGTEQSRLAAVARMDIRGLAGRLRRRVRPDRGGSGS